MMTYYFMPCFYAFIACMAICFVFNVRGKMFFFAPLGGALGWLTYLLCAFTENDISQFFLATLVITVYSEGMARRHKAPATGYLLISMLPMVPGGGIYYTMEYCILGNTEMFLETGLHTLGIAGAIAIGVLLVSSLMRLWKIMRGQET